MERFKTVVTVLEQGLPLPASNRDHALTGNWRGHRECHLAPDWLLIYRVLEEQKIIELVRLGSHSALF